jgi:hypothetical protein
MIHTSHVSKSSMPFFRPSDGQNWVARIDFRVPTWRPCIGAWALCVFFFFAKGISYFVCIWIKETLLNLWTRINGGHPQATLTVSKQLALVYFLAMAEYSVWSSWPTHCTIMLDPKRKRGKHGRRTTSPMYEGQDYCTTWPKVTSFFMMMMI